MSIGGGDGYGERDRGGEDSPYDGHGSGRLTTRTRLPDGETGSGGRPPARPGRSVVTVVGVVVLLVAAIAFANRGGGDGDSADGKKADTARPTAPTGTKPVEGGSGGIPAGFPKTEQGAQSAAANFAVALVSTDIVKPDERRDIVQQVFVPGKTEEMQTKMDRAYNSRVLSELGLDENGEPESGLTYVSRTAPMGTKVTEFEGTRAKLDVWCTGVFGTAGTKSTNPVTSDWFTMRMDLRWTDGDWKVSSFEQKEGPAPVNGDNKASSADQIADAVKKYGGFTYAR
ncbi:hypothetical protein ACWGJ2_27910 [Streptomyces sp. NPDC054796]